MGKKLESIVLGIGTTIIFGGTQYFWKIHINPDLPLEMCIYLRP